MTTTNDVPTITTTPVPYDPDLFQQARADIHDLISTPLARWMRTPAHLRRDVAYNNVLTIPLDLAAAGFTVTVTQEDAGWRLDVRRDLAPGVTLHLYGEARSWVATLYRLADMAGEHIGDVERRTKRQATAPQEGSAA